MKPRGPIPAITAAVTALLVFNLPCAGLCRTRDYIARIDTLMDQWQVEKAYQESGRLLKAAKSDKHAMSVAARLYFLLGEYAKAEDLLHKSGKGPEDPEMKLVLDTRYVIDRMTAVESGRYKFMLEPGSVDDVLVPYAVKGLDRQVRALSDDLGWVPPELIRIEIVPKTADLSRLTGLSVEAIETSGTIAVAKFNKLMVTSPRALLKGYRWLRTMCHELTHMALSQVSLNRAPLWLQEGLAKTLEGRYEQPVRKLLQLDLQAEHILALAVDSGRLLAFSKMRPSFAYMPSRETMVLAFAQVKTLVGMMIRDKGMSGVRELLGLLAMGLDEDQALKKVFGADFDGLVARWKEYVKTLGLKPVPGLVQDFGLEFAEKGMEKDKHESSKIRDKRVRDHLKLGEMLYERRRLRAAAVEYERADKAGDLIYPIVKRKFALALIELGKVSKAAKLLDQGIQMAPFDPSLLSLRAMVALDSGDRSLARKLMESVIGLSPFDPLPHKVLAGLYSRSGMDEAAALESKIWRRLEARLEER